MAQGNAHSNPFVIAALGASAGGLEAFEQYFKRVPSGARHRLRHHPALGPRPCQRCAGVPGRMHAGENPCALQTPSGSEYPGSSIGLAICQKRVERYEAEFARNLNMGRNRRSTFTIPAEAVIQ